MKDVRASYPGRSLDPGLIDARAAAWDQQAAERTGVSSSPPTTTPTTAGQAPASPPSTGAPGSHLDSIRSDPDFQKLPPASQVAVLAHFGFHDNGAAPSGGGFGSLSAAATPWSETAAEATPGPLKGFVRGAMERTGDPLQRLYNRGLRGVTTMPGQTLGDVASVGTALAASPLAVMGAPEAAVALAAGTGVQGIAEAVGASPNTARILGAVAEPLAGLAAGRVGVRGLEKTGEAIAREGAALRRTPTATPGAPQLPPRAELGGELQTAVRSELSRQKRIIGSDIGRLETQIVQASPTIEGAHPAYAKIASEVATLEERGITPPATAGKPSLEAYGRIRDAVQAHEPVATADVATLRRGLIPVLKQTYNPAGVNDPSTAFLRVFRNRLGDALEGVADQETQFKYATARDAYLNEVVRPEKILRSALSENTSPAAAYGKVFSPAMNAGNPDLQTFHTLYRTLDAGKSPALTAKLRMGFMEKLAEMTNDFADPKRSAAVFQAQRPALAATGLFTDEELSHMGFWLRKGDMPSVVEKAVHAIGLGRFRRFAKGAATGVGVVGGAEAAMHAPAIAHLAMTHPVGLVAAAVGMGGVKAVRTLAAIRQLPLGHSRLALLGTDLVADIGRTSQALSRGQHDGPSEDEGLVDH